MEVRELRENLSSFKAKRGNDGEHFCGTRDNLFVMSFNLASGVSILRVICLKASANVCWKEGETLEKTLGFCWKVGVAEMDIMKGLTTILSSVLPGWRDFFDIPKTFVEYTAENLR